MRAQNLVRSPLWATLLAALVAAVVTSLVVFVQSGKAIVGGEPAKHLKYPFMVALGGQLPGVDDFRCSGSLIKSGPGGAAAIRAHRSALLGR